MKTDFAQNEDNLNLAPNDRLKYISNPVYVWWNMKQREPTARFISNLTSPLQFLNVLWTTEIQQLICDGTRPVLANKKTGKLTPLVLNKFLGLELMRGYIGVRNILNMWSCGEIIIDYPGKSTQIVKNLWYAISNGLDCELSMLHAKLVERFKLYLVPGYHVTVDEIRIPLSHENCPFKNHNRDKPDIWALESKSLHASNGYLLDFINPCQHELPTPREAFFLFAEYLKTTERHHHMVADSNFLSALDLLRLYDMKFEGTISCKGNRPSFIWNDGLAHKLPAGYTRVASSERLTCICTRSYGKPKIATTLCVAREGDRSASVKDRRDVLHIYDKYKRSADRFGQLYKGQYPMGHHQNWIATTIIGWFYFTLTNAFVLYSMKYDNLTHEEFVYEIAKALI